MACICFAPDDGMWKQSKRHHASGNMSELGFLCLEKNDERHHLTPIRRPSAPGAYDVCQCVGGTFVEPEMFR